MGCFPGNNCGAATFLRSFGFLSEVPESLRDSGVPRKSEMPLVGLRGYDYGLVPRSESVS